MKTNQQHPITPPPELFQQLADLPRSVAFEAAYRAGADQELEACCLLLDSGEHAATYGCHDGFSLRATRRPKPPSLKEQALALFQPGEPRLFNSEMQNTIRRALEALPND